LASGIPERIDGHFRQYIEAKYGTAAVNDREKLMEALINLIEYGRDQEHSLHSFFDQVAHLISRLLAFDEIVMGLYDRKEKDYYNEVVFGYKDDIAIELKRLRYSNEDIVNQERFPHVRIGKLSGFNHIGGLSKSEQKSFGESSVEANAREFMDKFEKGDFIDTWMRDPRIGLVGWIKVAHPRDSRLPPKINVLWLELIASISACVVCQRWRQVDSARRNANGG
jgi:hypothetical protein